MNLRVEATTVPNNARFTRRARFALAVRDNVDDDLVLAFCVIISKY